MSYALLPLVESAWQRYLCFGSCGRARLLDWWFVAGYDYVWDLSDQEVRAVIRAVNDRIPFD